MLFIIALFMFEKVLSQNAGCDFFQDVRPGYRYPVYSPNYPASYPRPYSCRWIFGVPAQYQIRIDCYLQIPQTSGCSAARIMISKTGDPQFVNGQYYCGVGQLDPILSEPNRNLSLALVTASNADLGRFMCNVTAQAAPQPTCVCGVRKQNRIVGGTDANPNEFPMMTGLIQYGTNPPQVVCGATIINSDYVLTAAHCLENQGPMQVIVGSSNKDQTRRYNIQSITIHPSYNNLSMDYDIAVVRIAGGIVFNDNVGPACMPFKFRNTDLTGRNLTLLGWGTTSFGGPTSTVLQKVDARIISQQECMRYAPVTNRQLCNLTPRNDSCQRDSGGPGLYTDPQTGLLHVMGAVSSGAACGNGTPGINTRVTAFIDWVLANAPGTYCSTQ